MGNTTTKIFGVDEVRNILNDKKFFGYLEQGLSLLKENGEFKGIIDDAPKSLNYNDIVEFVMSEKIKKILLNLKPKEDIKNYFSTIYDKSDLAKVIVNVISYYLENNKKAYTELITKQFISGGIIGGCEACTRHKLNIVLLIVLIMLLIYIVRELYSTPLPNFNGQLLINDKLLYSNII